MEIEIDPRLFVTCRLCMKNGGTGMFQIIPTIQEQIRYCFDIEVNPFDGLPQLICKMCRLILNDYHKKKKLFKDNQESLQTSLRLKKDNKDIEGCSDQLQQESSSTVYDQEIHSDNDRKENTRHARPKKRRIKLMSSSSSDDLNDENSSMTANKTHETKIICPENYSLYYKCRFCSYEARIKKWIFDHFRNNHVKLMESYKNVIKKQCRISLNKIDNKINETERKDMVTINKRIILQDTDDPHYFIHLKKDLCPEEQSSDDENKCGKSIRRVSKSSNETVVLGNDNKSPILSVTDTTEKKDSLITINIDDSSNESLPKETIPTDESNIKQTDLENNKSIQTLTSICYNKYLKKRCFHNKNNDKNMGSKRLLKHKILSIGRKVINKRWFNCNGILRYVENKNLKIDWINSTSANDNNYVRINIKQKGQEKLKNEEWQDVKCGFSMEQKKTIESKILTQLNDVVDPVFEDECFNNNPDKVILNSSPVPNPKQLPKKNVGLEPVSTYVKASLSLANIDACHIVPAFVKDTDENDTSHLPIITSTTSLATTQKENKDNEETNSDNGSVSKDKAIPRIKVKPVSELMANDVTVNNHYNNLIRNPWNTSYRIDERPSHIPCPDSFMRYHNVRKVNSEAPNSQIFNLKKPESNPVQFEKNVSPSNIAFFQHNAISSVINHTTTVHAEQQLSNPLATTATLTPVTTNVTASDQIPTSTTDYMILDTVELPNTRTHSPYIYLKNLLRIHDINLHDSSETLPADFIPLIKFSLQFNQVLNTNKTEHEVKLMLSLLCSRNHFCLRIRDKNQLTVDINKLSANWQWQILKTCTGNVGSKLLQNAQKHSQSAHDYTKKVLCLLRSIKVIESS